MELLNISFQSLASCLFPAHHYFIASSIQRWPSPLLPLIDLSLGACQESLLSFSFGHSWSESVTSFNFIIAFFLEQLLESLLSWFLFLLSIFHFPPLALDIYLLLQDESNRCFSSLYLCFFFFAGRELSNVEPDAQTVQLNGARCCPLSSRRDRELEK